MISVCRKRMSHFAAWLKKSHTIVLLAISMLTSTYLKRLNSSNNHQKYRVRSLFPSGKKPIKIRVCRLFQSKLWHTQKSYTHLLYGHPPRTPNLPPVAVLCQDRLFHSRARKIIIKNIIHHDRDGLKNIPPINPFMIIRG